MNTYTINEDDLKDLLRLSFDAGKRVAIKAMLNVPDKEWEKASKSYANTLVSKIIEQHTKDKDVSDEESDKAEA